MQHTDGFWLVIQFACLGLLIGAFSSFKFGIDIDIYEFNTPI